MPITRTGAKLYRNPDNSPSHVIVQYRFKHPTRPEFAPMDVDVYPAELGGNLAVSGVKGVADAKARTLFIEWKAGIDAKLFEQTFNGSEEDISETEEKKL